MIQLSGKAKESIKTALAVTITYGIALSLDWDKAYWAAISAAFVSLATVGQSFNKAALRILLTDSPKCENLMATPGEMIIQQSSGDSLTLILSGSWKLGEIRPSTEDVCRRLTSPPMPQRLVFDSRQLTDWDSGLLISV
ncbi:MAG: FUSC family protein [Desulfobulbales bacterium]